MRKTQCTYWITVSGSADEIEAASQAIMGHPSFDGIFQTEPDEAGDFYFELKENTVEEISGFSDILAGIAASNPKVEITGEEIDEERHGFHRLYSYKNGGMADFKCGRYLGPDDYDFATVYRCIQVLKEAGFDDAAKLVDERVVI